MLTILALACASCSPAPPAVPLAECRVVDGDTLNCGGERIRLLGIDAPETAGHCRVGRSCAPGDPIASTAALAALIHGPLTISRVGKDRYGRTLGVVYAAGQNVSCSQLATGHAIYRRDWDNGGAVRRDCPSVAR